jgi:choline monooxygenase
MDSFGICLFTGGILLHGLISCDRKHSSQSDGYETSGVLKDIFAFDPELAIEKATTPPAIWYTSEHFLNLEKKSVLLVEWQPVGRVDQLRKDGDYIAGEYLGIPYVVVIKSGELRAFYNTCRHHASKIVDTKASKQAPDSSGTISSFQCPYHGWTYNLEGRLIKAPQTKGCDINLAEYGLQSIRVGKLGPFIFINFSPNAPALETKWSGVFSRLDYLKLKFYSSRSYTVNCNWKVYVDNYLDGGYHVPVLHRGLTSQLDLSSYKTEIFEDYSIQSCGGKDERIGNEAFYAWLYPGFMINRYGSVMDTNFVIPLSVDKTLVIFDFFTELDVSIPENAVFMEKSVATSEQVQLEDMMISEAVQSGLFSPAYYTGR